MYTIVIYIYLYPKTGFCAISKCVPHKTIALTK